jgi:hypothetical protein
MWVMGRVAKVQAAAKKKFTTERTARPGGRNHDVIPIPQSRERNLALVC